MKEIVEDLNIISAQCDNNTTVILMFYLNIISAKVILGKNWETKVINRKNIPQCDNNMTEVWK